MHYRSNSVNCNQALLPGSGSRREEALLGRAGRDRELVYNSSPFATCARIRSPRFFATAPPACSTAVADFWAHACLDAARLAFPGSCRTSLSSRGVSPLEALDLSSLGRAVEIGGDFSLLPGMAAAMSVADFGSGDRRLFIASGADCEEVSSPSLDIAAAAPPDDCMGRTTCR